MLEKLDIQWHVSKTKQISICILVLIALQFASMVWAFHSISGLDWNFLSSMQASVEASLGTSYYAIMAKILFWATLKLAFLVSSIIGLQKRLLWGAVSAALIAMMHLFTLYFPISLLIGWYLLPDEVREQIVLELRPLFTKEI